MCIQRIPACTRTPTPSLPSPPLPTQYKQPYRCARQAAGPAVAVLGVVSVRLSVLGARGIAVVPRLLVLPSRCDPSTSPAAISASGTLSTHGCTTHFRLQVCFNFKLKVVATTFITSHDNDRQLCRLLSYRQTDLRTHQRYTPQSVGHCVYLSVEIRKQNIVILSPRQLVRVLTTRVSPALRLFFFYFLTLFSFLSANSLKMKTQSEQSLSSTDLSSFLNRQPTYPGIGTMDTYGPSDEFRQLSDCLVCPSPSTGQQVR